VAATLAAWLLIVPLGAVCELFIHSVWFVAILCMGGYSASYVFRIIGNPTWAFPVAAVILVFTWLLATHESQFRQLEHVLGITGLFLAASVFVRVVFSAAAEKLEPVASWRGMTLVDKDSNEFREKKEFFEARATAYSDKYPFWLHLAHLYRVDPAVGGPKQGPLSRTAAGMHLFHGTRRESAHGIMQDGFRLPNRPGMFGKGIYFADCPLKSWQYTDGVMHIRNGYILLCWVELGRQSHHKAASNGLTRPPRRTFMQWLRNEERYTSVVGDDQGAGGALRVPEYVIYDTCKVQIDYICEVKCVPPGTAEEAEAVST